MNVGIVNRKQFRQAGKRVLAQPQRLEAHLERVRLALALEDSEPLQGALVDMVVSCKVNPQIVSGVLSDKRASKLDSFVKKSLQSWVESNVAIPKVNSLATRWCVIAIPSLGAPSRFRLCGSDDSRKMAEAAITPILVGDNSAEQAFLTHCIGSQDVLAYMLVRRALIKANRPLSQEWANTLDVLQKRAVT